MYIYLTLGVTFGFNSNQRPTAHLLSTQWPVQSICIIRSSDRLLLCFQWSLRPWSLWRRSLVTSQCQRWRAKKDVFNTLSLSTHKHCTLNNTFLWKSGFCIECVLFFPSVKIMELNLTHADLEFVPGVGLLFGVQNSSIMLSLHRQILYWLLLVLTVFWFDFSNTNLTLCSHVLNGDLVLMITVDKMWCVIGQLRHREHQCFGWRCECQDGPEFDQRRRRQTEDK